MDNYNVEPQVVNTPQYVSAPPVDETVTIGEWIITMLVMAVPCVNIVMMFVWAFGSGTKKSKANYFRATLIMMGVVMGIYILLFLIAGISIFTLADSRQF